MDADQLQRYRQAVHAEPSGPDLARTVAAIRDAGIEVTSHDRVKTAPRGFPEGSSPDRSAVHERAHRLAAVACREVAGHLPLPKSRVLEFLARAEPLQEWLNAHVGGGPPRLGIFRG